MFNLSWSLYNKSIYDLLKDSDRKYEESSSTYEGRQMDEKKEYTTDEIIQLAKEHLSEEEINRIFELEKNKTVSASQSEIDQLRSEIKSARRQGLSEGRTFGNYEGAYKSIFSHLGQVQHNKQKDSNFKDQIDWDLMNMSDVKNIEYIPARNYGELNERLFGMWETGDNRIDKTVFNSKDEYTDMKNSKKHNQQFAEKEKVEMDKLKPQIFDLQKQIDSLQDVENSEEYQNLDKKQTELRETLEKFKLDTSVKNYNPIKISDVKSKLNLTKKPETTQQVIDESSAIQKEVEKDMDLPEDGKEIEKQIKELKKKKQKIKNDAKKIKDKIIKQHKDAMNKYETHQQKFKKYQDDVKFWDDALKDIKKHI